MRRRSFLHEQEPPPETVPEEPPEHLETIGLFRNVRAANDRGLVLLAMGVAYWVVPREDGFHLCVLPDVAAKARAELDRFEAERAARKTPPADWPEGRVSRLSLVAIASSLCAWSLVVNAAAKEAGCLSAQAVLGRGEVWRAVTALTLHVGTMHLVSNLSGLLIFGYFVARVFGNGLGWLGALLGAMAGNLMNAWVAYPREHLSVGASTLVFALIGVLCGNGIWFGLVERALPRVKALLIPLCLGFAFLGLMGAGEGPTGGNTDVGAHFFGWVGGLGMGLGMSWCRRRWGDARAPQSACAIVAIILVLVSWTLAFATMPPVWVNMGAVLVHSL